MFLGRKFKSFTLEVLETVFTSVIVLMVVYSTIAFPETVLGSSMEPNFYTGERVLVERLSKVFGTYKRGDVVVLHPPGDDNRDYIKRIVGIPGDVVKIWDCKVYIKTSEGSFIYEENYLSEGECTNGGEKIKEGRSFIIEKDYYFVLGDNRDKSMDSRSFGLVEKKRIIGKAIFRLWPLSRAGFIN